MQKSKKKYANLIESMKKFLNHARSGQITLIAILLGVLGLTIGLSVASRSLADLKQASVVDFGTKAFAAAEAGAELGLNDVANGRPSVCPPNTKLAYLSTDSVNPLPFPTTYNLSSVRYSYCPDQNQYVLKTGVAKDDVVQIDVPSTTNGTYYVYWKNTADAGVEINELLGDGNYTVKRFAFYSASANGTNFSPPVTSGFAMSGLNCPTAGFNYQSTGINGTSAIQLRVKPLGNPGASSDILICNTNATGVPPQSYVIISTATTKNNTVRRVQVTKDMVGPLPSVFDNVIYSGGNISK